MIFKFHFLRFTFLDLVDVLLVSVVLYGILSMMKGTRAQRMIFGLIIILVIVILSQWFQLRTLNWLINKVATVWVIAFLIVFQPELRELLAKLGHSPIFSPFISREGEKVIPAIVDAAFNLAENRIGGLIVIEREVDLKRFRETGKSIGAKVSSELLQTIFTPHSPLHDGAIIIRGDTVLAAGAMLPLSINPRYERFLGTRHRAAIGISEQTDAIAVVVSEETGQVSFAVSGNLRRNLSRDTLETYLRNALVPKEKYQTVHRYSEDIR